jgi:cytochrome c556
MVAAFEAAGSAKTVVRLGPDVRWHYRIDSMEDLLEMQKVIIHVYTSQSRVADELARKLFDIGITNVDDLQLFFEELRPLCEFCVQTFRVPIKTFEAGGIANAAQAVWQAFQEMGISLKGAMGDATLASAASAGEAKLEGIQEGIRGSTERA